MGDEINGTLGNQELTVRRNQLGLSQMEEKFTLVVEPKEPVKRLMIMTPQDQMFAERALPVAGGSTTSAVLHEGLQSDVLTGLGLQLTGLTSRVLKGADTSRARARPMGWKLSS